MNVVRPRTIRGQLARILLVSLVLVTALLGVTVAREVREFRRSGETVEAVAVALAVQDLLHEAQRERGLTNGWLGGDGRLQNSVVDQRGNVDRTLRALDSAIADAPPGADQVRSAMAPFAALAATRTQIDAGRIPRAATFQYYTDGINALNHLRLGLDQAGDPEVRHGLQTLYALGEAKEQTAKERGFLNGVFSAEGFAPGEYVQFLDIRAAKMAGFAAFSRDATPAQQAMLDAALASENAVRAADSENVAIASTAGPLVRDVDPIGWWSQMTAVIDEQRAVQQSVGDAVRDRAMELRREAAVTLGAFVAAALLAVAAQIALVFASMRAIVRPLAALAAEADDVSERRLPEMIAAWHAAGDAPPEPPAPVLVPPRAGVEIAAVARALDRVQTTAVELASEQAVMRRNSTESMSNLARRNQNLVRRQLGLISEFEREEMDPKALSNLFELDHLATRMRRNAESLLVLVGEGSPRRWAASIPLTDVIRAGLSEVDDYRRVVLRRVDDVAIAGAVVTELAHMLAELIENGLAFSPPDLEVEIYGRKMATGYLLAVVDHGVGLPADQLAEANARLRGERDFLVAPTRYLGHYVVGRLARRLNIDVELNTSPVSGIVARLLLPVEILDGEHARPEGEAAETAPATEPSLFAFTEPEGGLVAAGVAAGAVAEERRPAHAAATSRDHVAPAARNGSGPAHAARADRPAPRRDLAAPGTAPPDRDPATASDIPVVTGLPRAGDREPPPPQWWEVPATEEPEGAAAVQRTRNGLVKRNKRQRGAENAANRPMPPRPPSTPVPERTPEEVRGMLSAFRTGVQRGAPAAAPGPAPARPAAPPRDEPAPLPHRRMLTLEAAPPARALPPAAPRRDSTAPESDTRAGDPPRPPLDRR